MRKKLKNVVTKKFKNEKMDFLFFDYKFKFI